MPPARPDLEVRPRRQHFSLAQVQLFLKAVLQLPASLRAAAGLFELLSTAELAPTPTWEGPSPSGGRWWLLRIGLYEVRRAKAVADDWVWIIDHTIQLGNTRVLLIVGLRLSAWEAKGRGALGHQDVQVMLLEPVQQSNAEIVRSQLETVARQSGAPRAILSDQCRELTNAVDLFQADHPQTLRLNDIKHRLALLLERQLKSDSRWGDFLQACQQMRKKSQQTPLAFLAPPATKEKARFMNLGELIGWSSTTLRFLDRPEMPPGAALDRERLESVFGELRQHASAIDEWRSLIDLIDTTLERVRKEGYHSESEAVLRRELTPLASHETGRRFVEQLLSFIAEQTAAIALQEHLPGSSEVIESLIGKGKRLEGQQSKGGFTRMVLGMSASVANLTSEYVQQALEATPTKHVIQWATRHLGPSLQGLRQQTLGRLQAEQIRDKRLTDPTPSF